MGLSEVWRRLPRASQCRVATGLSGSTTQSAGFASIVVSQHHGASDCSTQESLPTPTRPPLKDRMLALVLRRNNKAQKTSSQDEKTVKVKKQAWLSCDSATASQESKATETSSSRPKGSPASMRSSPPSMPEVETGTSEVAGMSLAQLAREARKIEGKSLSEIASEACELVKQEHGLLPHEKAQEQDQEQGHEQACQKIYEEVECPIEVLERQWAESIFVDYDFNQQQQLRRVIGLPVQRSPPGVYP
eukprot:TRINITY_DN24291_c0_g2_i1.p1 TRINITY_DN24291_c0_g2~~TRINITY_DN24291_c0_g2_i1.p1  ORF type:complete len:247 (+),score=41.54 TRINITY_DN24291_c0_g2_i1:41-781(+)